MANDYDVIVVGLGAMGSAAMYQLAKHGSKVLGIDQFYPPHPFGSTHGDTRITRLAIGEGAEYVPLVKRSHQIWREIEKQVGITLLNQCGGLILAEKDNAFLKQTIASAQKYKISHQELSLKEIKKRYPMFELSENTVGYYEPAAGFLRPELCVESQLMLAEKLGAEIKVNEKVEKYSSDGSSVTVRTTKGTYQAKKLIVSVGPWINELFPGHSQLFKIYRQVLYWFDLKNKAQYPMYRDIPIFISELGKNIENSSYGFPAIDGPDGGLKIASEDYEIDCSPEEVNREVGQAEIDHTYQKTVQDFLPGLSSNCLRAVTCLYTVTPDGQFVIDFHPEHQNVIIASPCSGHGFKHSAAVGEVLAQLATTGKSKIDISKFSLKRFKHYAAKSTT